MHLSMSLLLHYLDFLTYFYLLALSQLIDSYHILFFILPGALQYVLDGLLV